jgi:lipase chaperone LimK
MKKNKVIIVGLVIAILIVICITAHFVSGKKYKGYVFDNHSNIKAKDARIYLVPSDFNEDKAKDYFKNNVINSYTLKYFFFLDDRFKGTKDIEELLKKVHDYLYKEMQSREEADRLFAVYKTYTYYQQGLYNKTKSWGTPSTLDEAIDYLHKIQNYRREVFGNDIADALFGPSLKSEEYQIRRRIIAYDENKYGAEKEKILDELSTNMWGDEGNTIDSYNDPLNSYNEKLAIYQKDMAEMKSDDERQAMIQQFREEFFTPEQMSRLNEVDSSITDEKKKEEDYFAQENEIKNDSNLDADGKAQEIRKLQDQMFGSEADAFRRRLIIEKRQGQTGN